MRKLVHTMAAAKLASSRSGSLVIRNFLAAGLAAASLCASDATAAPLALFRTALQAQQHCPSDVVVWLDFNKRTYYAEGQRLFARGRTGTFVCRDEARKNRYRRSLLGRW